MAAEFSWTPPLTVLALGAVSGAVLVALRARHKGSPERTDISPQDTPSDLQRKYDSLIRRLAEGGTPQERAAIELEAARVLMEMDSPSGPARVEEPTASPAARPTDPTPAAAPRPASALAGFAYGVLAMGTLGGLFYLASLGASERPEGGSPTGGNTMGSAASQAPGEAADDPALRALEEAVQRTPGDVGQRIELTRSYLQRRDLMKVFDQTRAVLEIEPGQPHALTYQALVRVAMGQADQAETMLLEAIKKDPRIEDAYIHLAIARLQLGNRKGAEAAIQDGQKQFPEDKQLLADVFAQISSAEAEQTSAAPAGPSSGAGQNLPATQSAADQKNTAASNAPSKSAVVVIDLPQGLTVPQNAILFVIAREAGFDSGPPVAVRRVPAVNFPITVTLSEKDSMTGESLPGLLRIEARVDRDGDPMTKDPRDPIASEDNVRAGSGQVLLVLSPGK